MNPEPRRALLVHNGWVQAALLVILFGFFVLGMLAYRTYAARPPIPGGWSTPRGQPRLHRRGHPGRAGDLPAQRADGVRLDRSATAPTSGPDYTADYLRRAGASTCASSTAGRRPARARRAPSTDFKTNRYDPATGTLRVHRAAGARLPDGCASLQRASSPSRRTETRPAADRHHRPDGDHAAHRASSPGRRGPRRRSGPGKTTPTPTTGRPSRGSATHPTADALVWSVLSLIALLGGIGLLFARVRPLGLCSAGTAASRQTLRFRAPGEVALTPAQRATAWFFLVMAGLFLRPDAASAARRSTTAPSSPASSVSTWRAGLPYNLDAHLARPAVDLLGVDLVPGGRASSSRR